MSAFRSNFVVVIKVNGQILREIDDTVSLPFGSEYSILLKNLNNTRAVAKIEIDGQDVLDGHSIVVNQNSTHELKGFMKGDTILNRFKFIEKTNKISQHRGDRIEDGIVKIEYQFEEIQTQWIYATYTTFPTYYPSTGDPQFNNPIIICDSSQQVSSYNCSCPPNNVDGITVKGSQIQEKYQNTFVGNLSCAHIISLKLIGKSSSGNSIQKPMFVSSKKQCNTCGTSNKSHHKFCKECGSFLE